MGRHAKTAAQHRAQGTFQPSRHAGRGVEPPSADDIDEDEAAEEAPEPVVLVAPKGLLVGQRRAWDELVAGRPWITSADAPVVELAAVTLHLLRQVAKDIRTQGRYQTTKYSKSPSAAVKLWRQLIVDMERLSAKLGLSPRDRATLSLGGDDPDDSFAGEMQSALKRSGGLQAVE